MQAPCCSSLPGLLLRREAQGGLAALQGAPLSSQPHCPPPVARLAAAQSRKVSPPNLPTPEFFVPLGALIAYVRSGKKFVAVEPEDIRTGELSWQK